MNNDQALILQGAGADVATKTDQADAETTKFIDRMLDGLQSANTRRGYERAIHAFVAFQKRRGERLSKGLLNEFKMEMRNDGRGFAAINNALSAVRFFLREALAEGRLGDTSAAEVEQACKVSNIRTRGQKVGNWLTKAQAEKILQAPDTATAMGLRDRCILALLIGAGLRRAECAQLTVEHIQQREGRWCLVDVVGKRLKARTIPIAPWVKALTDNWLQAAGITSGLICRRASWGKEKFKVEDGGLSEQAIYRLTLRYGYMADSPTLRPHDCRRTFAKLAHAGGVKLTQLQLELGHESLEVTQGYVGAELDLQDAGSDRMSLNVKV